MSYKEDCENKFGCIHIESCIVDNKVDFKLWIDNINDTQLELFKKTVNDIRSYLNRNNYNIEGCLYSFSFNKIGIKKYDRVVNNIVKNVIKKNYNKCYILFDLQY